MHRPFAAACAAALAAVSAAPATADPFGPPAPPAARRGPLPPRLNLAQAIEEALARSPLLAAAAGEVEAARGRQRQAGFRTNPEIGVEVENFAGSGPYRGADSIETTVSITQRLDLGGRRPARIALADAQLAAQMLRLDIARADLERAVRGRFAEALAARDRLGLARADAVRAHELARIAGELVAAGREPPLRAMRARSALALVDAAVRAAEADEQAARRSLGALMAAEVLPDLADGAFVLPAPADPAATLDVRLAVAERAVAEAGLAHERATARIDPSLGIGVRQLRGSGDHALVAGLTMPIGLFDRNQGNIAAAGADIRTAAARRDAVLATARADIANAQGALAAADARLAALEAEAVPQAAEAMRLAMLSYRAGRSPLVELLDGQAAHAAAQSALIDARLARALAAAALARAAAR